MVNVGLLVTAVIQIVRLYNTRPHPNFPQDRDDLR